MMGGGAVLGGAGGGGGGFNFRRCLAWRLLWQVLSCVCRPVGGCVCPVLQAPAAGQGSPTRRPLGESLGRVTCASSSPRLNPREGVRGVARTCGLWRSLTDPEGHRPCCTECETR